MNKDEIKNLVIEGYRNILKRDPDHEGLRTYINHIENGMSINSFRDILRTSDEYKQKFEMKESDLLQQYQPQQIEEIDKIILISTWNIKCGIATYTNYLLDGLNKIVPNSFIVNPINDGILERDIKGRLTHIQHEFGIMPRPPNIKSKVIITWHTVPIDIDKTIEIFESNCDVVAHIVHSRDAREYIHSSKDVWIVHHGSMSIPEIKKEDARKILNINIDMPIGFVFGFQSLDKNYYRLIDAARNTGIHLMISGALHDRGAPINISNDRNVTFINRYLTDDEVNLYALASDILLFDYTGHDHCSVSGAMHRIVGAGRPVICSDIKHFSDINIAWKTRNQNDLENTIRNVLKDQESLGKLSLEYAKETSWKKVARKHVDIYRKYVNL